MFVADPCFGFQLFLGLSVSINYGRGPVSRLMLVFVVCFQPALLVLPVSSCISGCGLRCLSFVVGFAAFIIT